MENLRKNLKAKLNNFNKLLIIGVGSELRGDDAVGLVIAGALQKALAKNKKIKIISAGPSPENFTGEIKRFNPSHIIIIDACEAGKDAGFIAVIDARDIRGDSISTHRMPLSVFINYLDNFIKSDIIIIGIQPKTIGFNACLSEEMNKSIDIISNLLIEILK